MNPEGAAGSTDGDRVASLLATVAESATDGFLLVDAESRIRYANPAVAELFGYEAGELVGSSLTTLMPPRLRAAHERAVERYLETGERTLDWRDVRLIGRSADGEEVPVSVSFSEFGGPDDRRFLGVVRDVSDDAEAAFRERESLFRELAEHLAEVVWVSDPDTTEILYVNPAYEELWGRPPEELYDDPRAFLEGVHPADRDRVAAAVAAQPEGGYDEEYRVVRPDGSVRRVRDRATPIENAAGEVERIIGIATDVTEARERETELRRTADRVTDAIVSVDADWRFTFVDGRAEEIYGLAAEELLGRDFWAVFPDALGTRFEAEYRRAMATREPRAFEERFEGLDGWFRVNVYPEDDGGLSFYFRDVTERHERERALARSRDRFEIVRRVADVGYWEVAVGDGAPTEIAFTDDLFDTGLTPDEPVEIERVVERCHPDDRAALARAVERAIADGDAFDVEVRVRDPDGGFRWIETTGEPVSDDGEVVSLHGAYQDVTDRKRRESELEFRTALLEAVSETTIDGLLVVDDDREILEYNDRFLEIWDLQESFVESHRDGDRVIERALDRVAEPEEFLSVLEELWAERATARRDEFRMADGRWIDRYSAPVVDDDGTYYGRLWVFRDVTERRERERQLEDHKERLEAFAGFVSHDLRNPLNVAEGYLELEREAGDSEHLALVADALDRMRSLIDDLLVLARSNEPIGETSTVDLGALVRACWANVETASATISVETTREIRADESRLRQLVENLVRNAVEHGGPEVTVTVGDTPEGFFVEDDGPGVPEAERERVFDSGYSTDDDGTGFGLAIVETVAEAHGWTVDLVAGRNGGARFEFAGVEDA